MTDGHCDHCGPWCLGEDGLVHTDGGWIESFLHRNRDVTAEWQNGHCPACTQRDRDVAWLRARRDDMIAREVEFWPVVAAVLSVAAGDISLGNPPAGDEGRR